MCKGLAIVVWKDENAHHGWKVAALKGVKSHDELLGTTEKLKTVSRENRHLCFELTFPGTLQWDNPNEPGLAALEAAGTISRKKNVIGNLPILPTGIYLAIWEYIGQHPELLDWSPDLMQSPSAVQYFQLGDKATIGIT